MAARGTTFKGPIKIRKASDGSVTTVITDEGAVTADIQATAGSIGTTELHENTIKYAEVTISAAEILALRATPKQLVAAPGAGKVLEFVSAVLFLDHAGTGFTESNDNLAVRYENGSGAKASDDIETTGFIDQTGDTMTTARAKADAIVAKAVCENKALVLHNIGDGEFADGGTTTSVIRAKIAYRVHTSGW